MICRSQAALSVFVAAALVAAPSARAQRAAHDRHVTVGVMDKNGKPVIGLSARDFTVHEDGATREILGLAPAAPPSDIALLVDDSAVAQPLLQELRLGAQAFVRGVMVLQPTPRTAIVTFGGRPVTAVPFTTDRALLESGAGKLFPQQNNGAYLLDALVETCDTLVKRSAVAPVIIAFAIEDGADFSSADHKRVEAELRRAHASLWTILLQSREEDLDAIAARERAAVMGDVAAASGGRNSAILSKEGLGAAFAGIIAALGSRYDITYSRPDALIPPSRLEVQVRSNGAKVAAPNWTGE